MQYTVNIPREILNAPINYLNSPIETLATAHYLLYAQSETPSKPWYEALRSKLPFARKPQNHLIGIWQATHEYEYVDGEWECYYIYELMENLYIFSPDKRLTTLYTQDNNSERQSLQYTFNKEKSTIETPKVKWFVHRLTRYELELIEVIAYNNQTEYIRTRFIALGK